MIKIMIIAQSSFVTHKKHMGRRVSLNIHAITCHPVLVSEVAMKKWRDRIALSLTQDCNNLKIMQI